ncbi:hypothetical protein [Wenxinia marina]|nr:hypothetical protein [Wenxinia marina]
MGSFTSLKDVIRAVLRRWYLVVLICAVGVPLSVWYAMNTPRLYEATAVIQIEAPQVVETTTAGAPQAGGLTADSQLDLIEQRVMSRDSVLSIIDRFDLYPDVTSEVEKVALLRQSVTIAKLVDPAAQWRPDVQPSGLSISARMADPTEAAAVANEFLDRILAEAQRRSEGRAALTLEFYLSEEERVIAEIETVEEALTRYKEQNAASLPSAMDATRSRLATLSEQRVELERDLIALEGADRLRAEEAERQRTLLSQQRDLIDREIAESEAAIAQAPEVERQISAFERELAQLRDEFTIITQRRTEAAMNQLIESQDRSERFEVLETAVVPEFPVSTSRTKLAAAGAVAFGGLAVLLALALEMVGGRIRNAAQLEKQLGAKPVIVIPNLRSPRQRVLRRAAYALGGLVMAVAAILTAGLWRLVSANETRRDRGTAGVPAE